MKHMVGREAPALYLLGGRRLRPDHAAISRKETNRGPGTNLAPRGDSCL